MISFYQVIMRRLELETKGRLSQVEPPGVLLSTFAWYHLCCEYALADLNGTPFCWVCDDLADHLREVAKWSTKI